MKHFFCALILSVFGMAAQAAITPLSVSLLPPVQFPPSDYSITGLRLSLLWGQHRDIYGLDVGLLGNVTEQTFTGIGIAGLANVTRGTTTILGLQAAGLTNHNSNKTTVVGLQIALGLNYNAVASNVSGLQIAAVNYSPFTNIYGVQAGIYNKAKDIYGLQIGLVNIADNLHGIQIGLINFNHKGLIAMAPILNVGW